MCRPSNLWGLRVPTTGLPLYATVLAAILQCLPRLSHLCVAGVRGRRAASPSLPDPAGSRLACAGPHWSDPHSAGPTGRLHAHTPVHAPSSRSLHVPLTTTLRCMYTVDPTICQRVPSPRQHTTPSAAHARHGMGPSYFGRRTSYFGEKDFVLWGEGLRTLGRRTLVLWGEGLRTLGRNNMI
jgi:hypothetical protein